MCACYVCVYIYIQHAFIVFLAIKLQLLHTYIAMCCCVVQLKAEIIIVMAHQQQPMKEQPKPLRKLRALSGYNLWHSEYFHSAGLHL